MKIFVTGAAGFIGFHLVNRWLSEGHDVVGYDGMTTYYDPALKRSRLEGLAAHANFKFVEAMLEDGPSLAKVVAESRPEIVVHLAAQAGVRYSLDSPQSYIQSNIVGTANLLEALRRFPPAHLLFASTSSVYGGNTKSPFAEIDVADAPLSLYAATKKSGEAMVHSYAHLFGLPSTAMRFFTVYGPWGRPDMALFKFVSAILEGAPIDVYGMGKMQRDFTYVDDVVDAMVALAILPPVAGTPVSITDSISPAAPYRAVNIAGGRPETLMHFIKVVERALGQNAKLNLMPMQPGDASETFSDVRLLRSLIGSTPMTSIEAGVQHFVDWYLRYSERYGVRYKS